MATTEELIPSCTFQDLSGPEPWAAFRRTGLLRLRNGTDLSSVERARELGFGLFRDTEPIHPRCHRGNGDTGFTPPGVERVGNRPANTLRQFWDIRTPDRSENERCPTSRRFIEAVEHVGKNVARTAERLCAKMVLSLSGVDPSLARCVVHERHSFRVTHYPVHPRPDDELRFPKHRDSGLLTLMIGGSETGLQVEHDGAWYDLVNPPGDLVVMSAAMLRYWSGGPTHPERIPAVAHRVVHTDEERLALSFFVEPAPDVVMPHTDGKTAGAYIAELISMTRPRL